MNKPTWVKIIGVLAIVLGGLGVLGSLNLMVMPTLMEFQGSMMEAIDEQARSDSQYPAELMENMRKLWEMPAWLSTWVIVFGLIWLVLHAAYLLSGIMLLQMKPYSVRLITIVLAVMMAVSLIQGVTALIGGSLVGIMIMIGGLFNFVINLVLLIVVLTADKSAFTAAATAVPEG